MTARQRKFAQAYTKLGNATEAAKQAGYSPKTAYAAGSRLLRNGEVAAEIAKAQDRAATAAEHTLDVHVAKMAELAEEATRRGQLSAAVQATHHIGKAVGLYTDRVRVEGQIEVLAFRRREGVPA